MINIGLIGLGTVGSGVVEILNKRKDELKSILGSELFIKRILVKNINKKRDISLGKSLITLEFDEILKDSDISIIIEATGDLEESYNYIKKSLKAGKNVVTANKAVVSKYFEELTNMANKNNCAFLYEASVGGGIPILKPLKEVVATNEITQIQGILNGTCNYILTRMFDEKLAYEEALKIAQELGYAELDPTDDIEGYDTLRKLRILGTIALKGKISEEDILVRGIKGIIPFDIEQIKNLGCTVKLIAEVKSTGDKFTAMVQPTIIKKNSYFANVNMAFNSVAFIGNNVGELKFYGSGAGKFPTANAVLSDVLDIVKSSYRKGNPLGTRKLKNINEKIEEPYYLRVSSEYKKKFTILYDMADEILSTTDNIAIITKEVSIQNILSLISSLGIDDDKYFLGRIVK
ncbi:homoserine dehydrogenase [Tissierella praeacuta]|uniref:homoserine dehydrogenase n=1 Tax=Tissierella praeacuta TaxID=43131 RepID=UPI003DA44AF5